MATNTKIEWCDITINPVVGCSKISEGCRSCYAEKMAYRLSKMTATAAKYAGVVDVAGKWTGKVSALDLSCFGKLPQKPRRVFVGSMTDIFHEHGPTFNVELRMLWKQMAFLPQHTFMILTKRHERMADFCKNCIGDMPPLPNVWLGVTVCNQAEADEKIPLLLQTPAAKRFVSIEPMLGPVDLRGMFTAEWFCCECQRHIFAHEVAYKSEDGLDGASCPHCGGGVYVDDIGNMPSIDWVIAGGENGPGAGPAHPVWFRSLRDQCQAADVPFFFKGFGEWKPAHSEEFDTPHQGYLAFDMPRGQLPGPCGLGGCWGPEKLESAGCAYVARVGKARSGRLLDGVEYNGVPS